MEDSYFRDVGDTHEDTKFEVAILTLKKFWAF